MQENKLISSLIHSREAFDKLLPFVRDNTFYDFNSLVFDEIVKYYDKDLEATRVDVDVIKTYLKKKNAKKENLVEEYFASIPEPPSLPNVLALFADVQKEKLSQEVVKCLVGKEWEKAKTFMEEYLTFGVDEIKDELFNATPIEELELHFSGKNLIPVYPSHLTELLGGGVPRQSQLCIFARPDVGKSTASINLAVGAAEAGYKVLYLGNEDPAPKMMYRIISRFTRTPEHVLKQDASKYFDAAIKQGYGNLFFVPAHPGTLPELRRWVERLKPDLFIIDQIRNMRIKKESMTINLEQGCIGTRNIAKEFNCVSVIVTQAGDSARNKLVLDMEDVEWSNTGVAAQMDLMIGLGQNQDMKQAGRVMLSFPKNKLTAPIKPFTANIEYEINRLTV
mgnify:FL=1